MVKFFFTLDTRSNQLRKEGYPVVVDLRYKGKRKRFALGINLQENEWDHKTKLPKKTCKYYIVVKRKYLHAEKIALDYFENPNKPIDDFKQELLGVQKMTSASFYEFAELLIAELKNKNKHSNAKVYDNAINQLQVFRSVLNFTDIDYSLLQQFKDWQLKKGNKKNTISAYLRTYRSIYNEAVRRKITEDAKPFKDVMASVSVKANRTKKKYLTKDHVKILEGLTDLKFAQQRAVDLWLLLFYFGGQDLKDLYYLKKSQVAKNRVYFVRGKLDGNGYEFDLQIVPKAQKIINKYSTKGAYLFPWRKDFNGYRTFRDNFRRDLLKVVKDYNITAKENKKPLLEVQPLGGNITIKVARHTFATIGKQLFIETDLLRELMGHERNDVDTIYKDKYPEAVRDEAHKKIID